jgi:hypothetical protein
VMGDKEQMLQLYGSYTRHFVGSASRTLKPYTRMLRRKDNINYVALDNQDQLVGYVWASFEEKERAGEFREIIVDPEHDFEQVANCLIEKVHAVFVDKKAAVVRAGSLQNPVYEKLFPKLGFFESESTGVFMYAVLDVDKFLNELKPVFENRLSKAKSWKGLVAIECDEHSLFINRTSEGAQHVIWTNEPPDFKIRLSKAVLTRLIFGVADSMECLENGELAVESTTVSREQTSALLRHLFPRSQFLVMDFW